MKWPIFGEIKLDAKTFGNFEGFSENNSVGNIFLSQKIVGKNNLAEQGLSLWSQHGDRSSAETSMRQVGGKKGPWLV